PRPRGVAGTPAPAGTAGGIRPYADPRHGQLTAVRTDQGCNRADEGRLPRAVRAEQGGDMAGIGDEIETVQRRDLVETLAQPTSLDDRRHELTPWSCKAGISSLSERNRSTGGSGLHLYDKTERANVTGLPRLQLAELSSDVKSPTGPRSEGAVLGQPLVTSRATQGQARRSLSIRGATAASTGARR